MRVFAPGWTSYLLSGTVAILLSWMLSGCRFGNNVVTPENPDPITGYYQTQPQSLQFCVTFTSSATECRNVSTNQVPSLISQVLTQPVALQVTDPNHGEALFFDPFGNGTALPISIDLSNLELSYLGYGNPTPLWSDENCTSQLFIESEGAITKTDPTEVSGLTTKGRIGLSIEVFEIYQGSCTNDLLEIEDCYSDANQCNGSTSSENAALQESVQNYFNPYIESGAMSSDDISDVSSLGYSVNYN